jgi:hypothetical protein
MLEIPQLVLWAIYLGTDYIHCNAGDISTSFVGNLPGYRTVWYHPAGIAIILPFLVLARVDIAFPTTVLMVIVFESRSLTEQHVYLSSLLVGYATADKDNIALVKTVGDNLL